ncbi:MAG: IscS subfamily cysteine desulfurase [Eubacterium sp.]|jgi:cysteine desulfurase|nr:IscS subfamily cysteine desulfurase [Eubacterium sp.]
MIYLDNAATTVVSDDVLAAMEPYFKCSYGNASSIYRLGRESALALESARAKIASCFNCEAREIFFTGGGSESDNWAIKSAASLMLEQGKNHIVSTAFEHHAVLNVLETLGKNGFEVTYLPVHENGIIRLDELLGALRENTSLVTIMYVNNEIGTIQPISEIGKICEDRGILFHTDAVQAIGSVPIDVKAQKIKMMSASGHKIHAMKGVGFLYIDKRIKLPAFIEGGAQERGMRAGTENVAGIMGLAAAVEHAKANMKNKNEKLTALKEKIIEGVLKMPHVRVNGCRKNSVPGIANFSISGVEGESLLLQLDLIDIAASSGSACTSGSLEPSHVLIALGLPHEVAHGSLRISMSEYTTEAEIDSFLKELPPIVNKLRNMSPLWESMKTDKINI